MEQLQTKHGCATRYANGEQKLINFKKGERCICPALYPFWTKVKHFLSNVDYGIYKKQAAN